MSVSFFANHPSPRPSDPLPFGRAALALAEAIIPGSATIPAADETTVALADEAVGSFHPSLKKAWRIAQATLDAAAIAQKGRAFHSLSAEVQEALIRRWEQDPVLRIPLNLVSLIYRFVHFDRPAVYEALGGAQVGAASVKGLEEPRWLQQIDRAEEWAEGDDVECEVVVIGTGAGGAVVGKELADGGSRSSSSRRGSTTGATPSAGARSTRTIASTARRYARERRDADSSWGGSSAAQPRSTAAHASAPRRGCSSAGAKRSAPPSSPPMRMKRHFARVEDMLQVAPTERRFIGPIADVMSRGCDALGWQPLSHSAKCPRLRRLGLLRLRLSDRREAGDEHRRTFRPRSRGARSSSPDCAPST